MIAISKPEKVPDKLIEVQNEIAEQLYKKKDKFKWETRHYSAPIKEDLKLLYHNKCAFCECELTIYDYPNQFTVEHYRPKEYYYWLGAEWTNLFPTCDACNGKKKNNFPLRDKRKKIELENAPFDTEGKLIAEQCLVTHNRLVEEEPLYLHPEIDKPEKYFAFDVHGKAILKSNLSKFEEYRANEMLIFLNSPGIEEKRKSKICYFQKELLRSLNSFLKITKDGYSKRDIMLSFDSFFIKLLEQKEPTSEFSLLGACMIEKFDVFFLDYIRQNSNEACIELVLYARKLLIKE